MVEYVRLGGRHVAYRVDGRGPLTVLYLSGLPVSIDLLDDEPHIAHLNRRLAALGRVVQYDPPGIGLSDPPNADVTIEYVVNDVIELLDALGVTRVAVVAANDSGTFALPLAAALQDRCAALVLIDTQARVTRAEDYPYGVPEGLVDEYVDQRSDPRLGSSTKLVVDADASIEPGLMDDVRYRQWAERALRQSLSPAVQAMYLRLIALRDVRPCLASITAPTLVLARRDNAFVPPAHGRYLADHIVGARFVEVPGKDHAPYSGDVDALMDEVGEFLTGQRGGGERVLATVVFTDIVGSTQRAAQMGDRAWRALLDAHDVVVEAALAKHGGRAVNTTGDGFVAAFDSPSQAIAASRSIIAAVQATGLTVRIGIHTGECERRGENLAGLTVHVAARIGALAAENEILVSRTICDLLAGANLSFAPRGEHDLKGVPDKWQLFAVIDAV